MIERPTIYVEPRKLDVHSRPARKLSVPSMNHNRVDFQSSHRRDLPHALETACDNLYVCAEIALILNRLSGIIK